jgi:hypothetical protein
MRQSMIGCDLSLLLMPPAPLRLLKYASAGGARQRTAHARAGASSNTSAKQ